MTAFRYLAAWLVDRHRLALDLADARDENVHLARQLDTAESDSAYLAGVNGELAYLVAVHQKRADNLAVALDECLAFIADAKVNLDGLRDENVRLLEDAVYREGPA